MQQAPAPAGAGAHQHQHEAVGRDAPPKQVAQAMERLGRAGRLIADIRLGADRLLEALFVAGDAPPHSAQKRTDRTARAVAQEEAAMHRHFDDLRALGSFVRSADFKTKSVWNCAESHVKTLDLSCFLRSLHAREGNWKSLEF